MNAKQWNDKYKPGQQVNLKEDDGSLTATKTRSIAWQLLSGEHVVMVEGKRAGYLLSRIAARGER